MNTRTTKRTRSVQPVSADPLMTALQAPGPNDCGPVLVEMPLGQEATIFVPENEVKEPFAGIGRFLAGNGRILA